MKFVKIGFQLYVGWYLSDVLFRIIIRTCKDVSEIYQNKAHPDHYGRSETSSDYESDTKMKIGFSID